MTIALLFLILISCGNLSKIIHLEDLTSETFFGSKTLAQEKHDFKKIISYNGFVNCQRIYFESRRNGCCLIGIPLWWFLIGISCRNYYYWYDIMILKQENNYPTAIQLCLECQKAAETFKQFKCIRYCFQIVHQILYCFYYQILLVSNKDLSLTNLWRCLLWMDYFY